MSGAEPGRQDDSRFGTALNALRREVLTGRFAQSDMLPGERELAEQFGVSRTTLRRVLSVLVRDGVLTHRQGVGTFVKNASGRSPGPGTGLPGTGLPGPGLPGPGLPGTDQRDDVPPDTGPPDTGLQGTGLLGFAEITRARGSVPSTREISRGLFAATPEEAAMLGCWPAAKVLRLHRIRYVDDVAVAVDRAAVAAAFLDSPDKVGSSLYAALEEQGFRPERALVQVEAIAIGADDASALGLASGLPALLVRRTTYLPDGRCCEFTRSVYKADRYDVMADIGSPPLS